MSVKEPEAKLREKAVCTKWLDNDPPPCPIDDLELCCKTEKPCKKADLMVSCEDAVAFAEGRVKEAADKHRHELAVWYGQRPLSKNFASKETYLLAFNRWMQEFKDCFLEEAK